ncbi:hypothetical protein DN410_24610 [Bacillus sp. SH5-2]|nr:hypothetical protein DN410_24610 [Bacillus sp. SH5-2]
MYCPTPDLIKWDKRYILQLYIRYKDGLYYRAIGSIIYKQLHERNMQIIYPAHSNRFEWAFCLLYEQSISFNTIME